MMVELSFHGMSGSTQACGMIAGLIVGGGGLDEGIESVLIIVVARMGVVVCS